MFRGLFILVFISTVAFGGSASAKESYGNSQSTPVPLLGLTEHNMVTVVDLRLDEKHSLKIGGDFRHDITDGVKTEDEAIVMARYKFSF